MLYFEKLICFFYNLKLNFTLIGTVFQHGAANRSKWGENPLGITGYWPMECSKPPMLWGFRLNRFQWAWSLNTWQTPKTSTSTGNLRQRRLRHHHGVWMEKTGRRALIFILLLCLGEKGPDELHKKRPHLDLVATRYPRVLDAIEAEFKMERNETFETF